ncbi:MAG: hypothetical protein JWN04_4361 [Myxococcaceae bacterium]|nr:hypothetical protein [Myxococcaceae bacterium]
MAGALLAGCSHHDSGFLSLRDLCTERVDDICAARNAGCPCPTDPSSCEDAGIHACQAEQDALTAETGRSYDSVAAARQSQAARAVLNTCGAPPPLASYFQGGLPLASACERPSQCASGACTGQPPQCSELVPVPLCP